MFIYYNPNPLELMVNDCTIRALCRLENTGWEDVSLELFLQSYILRDVQTSSNVFNSLLKNKGYVRKRIPDTCPDCYTVLDFCKDNPSGKYIVSSQTHVISIIDGDYYDTYDSGKEPIIFYWEKVA